MAENNWSYIGVFLDKESKDALLNRYGKYIPEGWKVYAHHMTIAFNNGSDEVKAKYMEYQSRFGEKVNLIVTGIGISDDAIAVKVTCDGVKSANKLTHITLAVPEGGKPVNSNYITNWEPVPYMPLSGVIDEFLKKSRPLTEDKMSMEGHLLDGYPIYIAEGLIHTYPIETVANFFQNKFNLTSVAWDYDKPEYQGSCWIKRSNSGSQKLIMVIPNYMQTIDKISRLLVKYGYDIVLKDWDEPKDDWVTLYIEKKFDEDLTDYIKSVPYLYHITTYDAYQKIIKIGLKPSDSQWRNGRFPSQGKVYAFTQQPSELEFKYWANDFFANKKKSHNNPTKFVLLSLDTSKLRDNVKFYRDPRMMNGVYTYDNIAPDAINLENTITL